MSDFVSTYSRLPRNVITLWVIWFLGAIAIFFLGAQFRIKEKSESVATRLARLELQSRQQYESLLHELRRLAPSYTIIQVGTLQLPPPAPEKHVGWEAAILDTTQAESLKSPRVTAASKIFAEIADPNSLAAQVLSGKVRIDFLKLITPDPGIPKGGICSAL